VRPGIGFVFWWLFTRLIRHNSFPRKYLPFLPAQVQLALFGTAARFVVTPQGVSADGQSRVSLSRTRKLGSLPRLTPDTSNWKLFLKLALFFGARLGPNRS
jgi:hypothetical protein